MKDKLIIEWFTADAWRSFVVVALGFVALWLLREKKLRNKKWKIKMDIKYSTSIKSRLSIKF